MAAVLGHKAEPRDRRMLLITHAGGTSVRRCARCDERAASWRLTGPEGDERDLCVYCASLMTTGPSV